ncbi:hypothetical protein CH369_10670, partial [Leptospira levettii]
MQNLTEENFSKYDWKRIKVPGNLTPPKENEKQKRTVILAKWIEMDVDPNIQYSFRLGIINDRDRTYLNGKLIGKTGEWDSPFPQNYDKLRIYSIPSHLILPKKKNLLLIKIQLYFQNSGGIEQDETLLGPSTNIQNRFY